jgi:hypothetical protein
MIIGNWTTDWQVMSNFATMEKVPLLGAYPSGVQMHNIGHRVDTTIRR